VYANQLAYQSSWQAPPIQSKHFAVFRTYVSEELFICEDDFPPPDIPRRSLLMLQQIVRQKVGVSVESQLVAALGRPQEVEFIVYSLPDVAQHPVLELGHTFWRIDLKVTPNPLFHD